MAILKGLFAKKGKVETSNFMEEVERFVAFIQTKCKKHGLNKSLESRVENILAGDELFKKDNLPGLFFSFEQYLMSLGMLQAIEEDTFRKFIKSKFPFLSESRSFSIIYLNEHSRNYVLCSMFIMMILERAQMLSSKVADSYLEKSYERLITGVSDIFEYKRKVNNTMQLTLQNYSREIYEKLGDKLGISLMPKLYNEAYEELAYNFLMLEGFTSVLFMFPEKLLDEQQINLLNAEQIKGLLLEKVGSLQYANQLLKIEVKERKKAQDLLKQREVRITKLNEKLEKNNDELDFANKELESFSHSLGHDLMAPLRAINGFSKILINDYNEVLDDEGLRILNIVTNNSKKMGRLIDDLMTYSNLSKDITLNTINTKNVIQEYLYENKIEEDRLNIKTLHNINADKMLIKLVFANLIGNAIKFSAHEKTPKIEIGSEEKDSEVEFYIKDNGIGFEMSLAAKLFGLFEKLHPETKFSGTGVGLAIVLKIISNHKGKIWANSEPNKGATFYFTIPK